MLSNSVIVIDYLGVLGSGRCCTYTWKTSEFGVWSLGIDNSWYTKILKKKKAEVNI